MADNGQVADPVSRRIPAGEGLELDELDYRLIALLREDGRMSFKAMAEALELTEATVRARVRRLEESDTMRVVAVTDFEAAGYSMMLAVGIQVEGRPASEVAEALAAFPEVFSVCQVVGTLDIEVLAVAEDQGAVAELLTEKLSRVPGVRRVVPALAVDLLKNQPNWVPFSGADHD